MKLDSKFCLVVSPYFHLHEKEDVSNHIAKDLICRFGSLAELTTIGREGRW